MDIILDIETAPDPDLPESLKLSLFAGIKGDSRLKDPEKIERDILEKQAKLESEFALSPLTGKIACIVTHIVSDIGEIVDSQFFYDGHDEKSLLSEFILYMNKTPHDRIVGFNLLSFDLPFIRTKGMLYHITPCYSLYDLSKYSNKRIVDLRLFLTGDLKGKGTLDQWGMRFGIAPNQHSQSPEEMFAFYRDGNLSPIVQNCDEDVRITGGIYINCKEWL